MAVILLLAGVAFAGIDAGLSVGPVFPVGGWGQFLSTGLDFEAFAGWGVNSRLSAGPGVSVALYGDGGGGDASLTVITPEIRGSFFLRPGARSFNPGVEAAFGYSRSSLSSGGGEDPVTWDPSWRAGLRWDFSLGGGFRGAAGFDFRGILSGIESADGFSMVLRVSKEVAR